MKIQIKIGQQKTIKKLPDKDILAMKKKRTIWYISLLFIFLVLLLNPRNYFGNIIRVTCFGQYINMTEIYREIYTQRFGYYCHCKIEQTGLPLSKPKYTILQDTARLTHQKSKC